VASGGPGIRPGRIDLDDQGRRPTVSWSRPAALGLRPSRRDRRWMTTSPRPDSVPAEVGDGRLFRPRVSVGPLHDGPGCPDVESSSRRSNLAVHPSRAPPPVREKEIAEFFPRWPTAGKRASELAKHQDPRRAPPDESEDARPAFPDCNQQRFSSCSSARSENNRTKWASNDSPSLRRPPCPRPAVDTRSSGTLRSATRGRVVHQPQSGHLSRIPPPAPHHLLPSHQSSHLSVTSFAYLHPPRHFPLLLFSEGASSPLHHIATVIPLFPQGRWQYPSHVSTWVHLLSDYAPRHRASCRPSLAGQAGGAARRIECCGMAVVIKAFCGTRKIP